MKIIDGAGLWTSLQREGLTEKRIGEMSLPEVELMAAIFADHVDGDIPPFWNGNDLIVPFAAPHALRWWMHSRTPEQRLKQLREAGVPEEKLTMYMSRRDIDRAEGRADEYGNKIEKHG